MQSIELAWAAGFYDGEGSTGVERRRQAPGRGQPYVGLVVEVTQVDERPLRRFAAAVGVGRINLRPRRGNRQPQWRWRAAGGAARRALRALWPYLSEPKREQALRALDAVQRDAALRQARYAVALRGGGAPRPTLLSRLRARARAGRPAASAPAG